MKLKIGLFSFTCCEGCIVTFIEVLNKRYFDYLEKIEIVNFRALRTSPKVEEMDIAFVEGAISTDSELRKLKEIRKKTKKLVALGSAAVNGYPSNQRNDFDKEKNERIREVLERMKQRKKISPVTELVKVDDEINGCPVDQNLFMDKLDEYLGIKKS